MRSYTKPHKHKAINFLMVMFTECNAAAGECPQALLWPPGSAEIIFACGTIIIAMNGTALIHKPSQLVSQACSCQQKQAQTSLEAVHVML